MTAIDTTQENRKLAANQTAVEMPELTTNNVREAVKDFVGQKTMTVTEIANYAGVSRATIYNLINEKAPVSMDHQVAILKAIGYTVTFDQKFDFQ